MQGSLKITPVDLSVTCSAAVQACAWRRQRPDNGSAAPYLLYLVGDAAFGVPFFRSLNNGIICGTRLAESLATVRGGGEPAHTQTENYTDFVMRLADKQIRNSRLIAAKMQTVRLAHRWTPGIKRIPKAKLVVYRQGSYPFLCAAM